MGDAILKWANRVCRGHDHIRPPDDFEESWADGMCFCALYYAYFPDKIPIKTLTANTDEEKLKNLALAFEVGKQAGVEPLLDSDDTLHVCEKKSILLYLSEAYSVLKDEYTIKFSASAEWNKKYEAEEKARKFAEWKLQKEAESRGEIWNPPKSVRGGSVVNSPKPASTEEPKPVSTPTTPAATKSIGKKWDPKGLANNDDEEKTPAKTPEPKPVTTPVTKTVQPVKPVSTPTKTVEPVKPVSTPTPVVASKTVETVKPASTVEPAKPVSTPTPVVSKTISKTEEKPAEPAPFASPTSPSTISKNVSKRWDPKANQSNEEKEEKTTTPESSTPTSTGVEAGLTYEIGRGKEGGSENRMHIFSVQFKIDGRIVINPKKEDIGVYCECPGTEPRFTIMVSNNAYHIGFTPAAGGQHWFDFTYKGTSANEPFCLPVKDKFNKVPDHPYTGTAKPKT